MTKLVLLRHTETIASDQNLYCGSTDVDLNDVGIAKANKLGQKFYMTPFDIVITSRLTRSVSTAQIILQHNIFKPKYVLENEIFNERHLGALEMKTFNEVNDIYGSLVGRWYSDIHALPPAGETLFSVYRRVTDFWKKTVEPLVLDNNILLVSHYHIMQAICCYIDDISFTKMSEFHFDFGQYVTYEF